ncbi:hypothetical protein [Streptomyces sp. NPDC056949]|uniref:hypothetical protein n=1 Tax=Streptomyces sp. NPDC056949 TaxID=3345976 RepID=UPI0036259905
MSVARRRDLRDYANFARERWKQGADYHVAVLELSRAGIARPDRAMRAVREITAEIEQVGWRYVNAEQVLTEIKILFARP